MDLKHFTGLFGLHLPCRSYLFVAEMVLKSNSEIPKLCTVFFSLAIFSYHPNFGAAKSVFIRQKHVRGLHRRQTMKLPTFSPCHGMTPLPSVSARPTVQVHVCQHQAFSRPFQGGSVAGADSLVGRSRVPAPELLYMYIVQVQQEKKQENVFVIIMN